MPSRGNPRFFQPAGFCPQTQKSQHVLAFFVNIDIGLSWIHAPHRGMKEEVGKVEGETKSFWPGKATNVEPSKRRCST